MRCILSIMLIFFALHTFAQSEEIENVKLKSLQEEKNSTILKEKIKQLAQGSVDDLNVLIQYYQHDSNKKNEITKLILDSYPESINARMLRMQQFLKLEDPDDIAALVDKMITDYPNVNLDAEKSLAAMAFAELPDTAMVMKYANMMVDPVYKVYVIKLVLDIIDGFDSETALVLADAHIKDILKLKTQTAVSVTNHVDPQMAYYEFTELYSKLLFKADRLDESFIYTKEAYDKLSTKDADLVRNYGFLSSIRGLYDVSLPILSNVVKNGNLERKYIDQVRIAYANLYPDHDVEAYIDGLKSDFINKIKDHVSILMIDEPSPNFVVKDIYGKEVSLADFSGKTLVLDFWATWCGPCVASFPAMQMALNRYKNDSNVEFLFIHTWENNTDPVTDAKEFLSKRDYDFDLYMDLKDPITKVPPAITLFKAKGIPAKYIIDPKGKIRFKAEGFSGSAEAAAEEVVQMVEMARK